MTENKTNEEKNIISNNYDPLLPNALLEFIESDRCSITLIQRKFAIGYARAASMVEQMEQAGFISAFQTETGKREILINKEKYKELFEVKDE
ncbi:MAG: hypothetical protein IJW25_01460 [Clostridia bacterium]|nr:hypothetical protein [Clostridia bacterium]